MERLDSKQVAELNAAYLSILRYGLPYLRNLTRSWPERAIVEAEHLHEIPNFIDSTNPLVHIDYLRRMCRQYFERQRELVTDDSHLAEEDEMYHTLYKREWEKLRAVLQSLPEWKNWVDY